jgi:hypothetical protein
MKRFTLTIFAVFLIFSLFSCDPEKSQINEKPTFSKIIIQIFPVFCTHSQIVLDVRNNDMVFDMIGDVRFIKIDANYDIKPFFYKFNAEDSKYLSDSILVVFDNEEFSNSYHDFMEDGIGIDILYVLSDGKTKKIELSNSSTTNQSKLISFLFETIINNCSDSTTIAYSELINKYY